LAIAERLNYITGGHFTHIYIYNIVQRVYSAVLCGVRVFSPRRLQHGYIFVRIIQTGLPAAAVEYITTETQRGDLFGFRSGRKYKKN